MEVTESYLTAVREAIGRIEQEAIQRAATFVAASLENGGIVHVFGTGHSSLLAQEVFYRAGGLVAINPILDPRLGFEKGAIESTAFERNITGAADLERSAGFQRGDAGIVISNSGRNGLPVEIALRMKMAGMSVIALTSLVQSRASNSRHPSGRRLFEIADTVLDNHCPPGDAAVEIAGIPHRLGPLSTVVGAVILHSVLLGAASLLAEQGNPPATFVSANVGAVAPEDLRRLIRPYAGRIRYYR